MPGHMLAHIVRVVLRDALAVRGRVRAIRAALLSLSDVQEHPERRVVQADPVLP